MVKDDALLDSVFHALSHRARRDMVHRLCRGGDHTVGQLAAPLQMSLAAASKHVRVLEDAGLLRRKVTGREHVCSLSARRLAVADHWLRSHEGEWNRRLDNLEALLASEPREAP
jgi:DNA-binding transcriptional ArsR family regulator